MGFKEVADLSADTTISLGGTNKKTGKANPKSIEGYFLGSKQVADKKKKSGKSFIYIFQTAKGNVGVWGKTDLDQKMGAVTPGTMVRATYDRMVPTPNGDMYKYKVEVDTENTIDVGLVAGANNQSNESEGIETTDDEGTAGGYEAPSYEDEEESEDDIQAAALANLERKKRMETVLNKGKNAKN
jgi:hypothetical protein